MKTKKLLVPLLGFLLSACAGVTLPNTEACAVAGVLGAGANCAMTLSDKTREMDVLEFIQWLEPQKDRGPAICQSSEDYEKIKTALEQACAILENRCTKEMIAALKNVDRRLALLVQP